MIRDRSFLSTSVGSPILDQYRLLTVTAEVQFQNLKGRKSSDLQERKYAFKIEVQAYTPITTMDTLRNLYLQRKQKLASKISIEKKFRVKTAKNFNSKTNISITNNFSTKKIKAETKFQLLEVKSKKFKVSLI